MSIEFKLPAVGENVDTAEVGSLRVAEGDVISADQIVMEIETDKAVFELPCPNAGKITKIHVKPGDTVKAGAVLLTIDESSGGGSGKAAPESKAAKSDKPESESKAGKGQAPAREAAPADKPAPDSTNTPAPKSPPAKSPEKSAPAASPATKRPAAATAVAKSSEPAEAGIAGKPPQAAPASETDGEEPAPAPAGPATRRLARELGVDLHHVSGSGPGGRITSEDVQAYVRERLAPLEAAPTPFGGAGPVVPPLPDFSQFGAIERQPLNKIMRTGAANVSLAWNVIPHVTQHELADVTELEAARKRSSQSSTGKDGPKITMTVLAMKAVVSALKTFPRFNSSYDAATGEVVLKRYYNIGIAVDTENGLMVPVIRSVDSKSVVQLAGELTEIARKARDRKLAPADMQGGSFTITNLGGIGGTYFTPIVNYPEVAILGLSRTSQQQIVVDVEPRVRLMLPLSLSYDHRVINGADAARFIVKLASLLSDPFQLMSEV
jgi:pyruvate dehydrogenase E2 component (dihydrolipoamide acetyltransferase)